MRMWYLLAAMVLMLAACTGDSQSYLVITSDIHLSNPNGRWPFTTKRFEAFLSTLKKTPPQILFVVGDMVDNARYMPDRSVKAGDKDYWTGETELYHRLQRLLPETEFRQSLGPGHDFIGPVSLDLAAEKLDARNGSMSWNEHRLIWFTIPVASFWPSDGGYRNSLSEDQYTWLIEELQSTRKAILLFHVPLRTSVTLEHGKWADGSNLTIDPRDRLYEIIDKHSSHISAIFNGHIHKFIQTKYQSIPLYLCPFFDHDCYCKVYTNDGELHVHPTNCS